MEPEDVDAVIPQQLEGRITIYSITGCIHCHRLKACLTNMGLPFVNVDVMNNSVLQQQLVEITGRHTVPQIYFNNVHVGGNDDFQNLTQEELDKLIDLVKYTPAPPDSPPIPQLEEAEENVPKEELKHVRDDYADLVLEFKQSGIIGSHWSCLKMYPHTFTGKKLVNWLVEYKNPASRLSEFMRDMILQLFSEHITPDGKYINYKSMVGSAIFEEYCQLATQLQRLDLENLTRKEKLAFFINVYNALVIHGNIKQGPPKNIWQRYKYFNSVSYVIGGEVYTLQDIENGVLRGNRKGIGQIIKPFSKGDPRLQIALEEVEPLIHFALNCGVRSCPPIKTYTAQEIDTQLKISTEAFLDGADGCQIDVSKKEVRLSQIFKWYKIDFGGTDEKVLQWVFEHLGDSPKKKVLKQLLEQGMIKVTHLPYDWSTNALD
uniref:uncharacterized protein isoform X3 n=1 Tax=Pristiophorus japonicus TaxID=55135 RepID=UPI00398E87AD